MKVRDREKPAEAKPDQADDSKSARRATPRRRLAALTLLLVALAVAAVAVNWRYLRRSPAQTHIERGIALANAHKPVEAEREWREALRTDPSLPEPYQLLSRLYLDADRPDQA